MKKINPSSFAFPAAASRIVMTGAMGSARSTSGHDGRTSGTAARSLALSDAHRYDPNRFGTNEFVQFCIRSELNLIWRRTCAAFPPRNSIGGLNTATPPREAPRWPTCARPWDSKTLSMFTTGEWGMSPGDAAETSRLRSTPWNIAGSRHGRRVSRSGPVLCCVRTK